MNRGYLLGSALSVVAMLAGLRPTTSTAQQGAPANGTTALPDAVPANRRMTIWRDPSCGCCDVYADYMEDNGFAVTRIDDRYFDKRSIAAGVPAEGLGWHLSEVDGYYISGLVPFEIIDRLTAERPDVIGITLPGMPQNAPGMAGKSGALKIYAFSANGVFVYSNEWVSNDWHDEWSDDRHDDGRVRRPYACCGYRAGPERHGADQIFAAARMKPALCSAATSTAMTLVAFAAVAQAPDNAVMSNDAILSASVGADRIAQGKVIYETNCASCHGASLEGQPDWRRRLDTGRMPAPPHDETGHTWHHPDADLVKIIKSGLDAVVPGYESDMPAFGSTLSDTKITDVLAYMKSTWPDRQRDFQAEVTANDTTNP